MADQLDRRGMHRNISSLEELDEFALRRCSTPSTYCLLHRRRPEAAAAYQVFWKQAGHGTAYLEVEKTKLPRKEEGGSSRRAAIRRRRDPKLGMWTQVVVDFFNLWATRAPRRLQGSIVEWVQKANKCNNNGGAR